MKPILARAPGSSLAVTSALVLAALLGVTPASASDNRLQNPGFDAALAGWVDMGDGERRSRFSGDDATGQSTSGSIELRQFGTALANLTARFRSQCIPLAGLVFPQTYGASARVDLVQGAPARARLWVFEYGSLDCQGAALSWDAPLLVNDAQDAWRSAAGSYTPGVPGAVAVRIELGLEALQSAGGSGLRSAVRFDDVFFGGSPGPQPAGFVQRQATVDAGGGHLGAGGYAHASTLGQPDAGSASGAGHALQSGFWHTNAPTAPPADTVFSNGFE